MTGLGQEVTRAPNRQCSLSEALLLSLCTVHTNSLRSESVSDGCASSVNRIFIWVKGALGFHAMANRMCYFYRTWLLLKHIISLLILYS